MADVALLCDFGSTYTKLTAVDLSDEAIVAATRVPTTVTTHLADGLRAGEVELKRQGIHEFSHRLACSSAAGGLKMAVSGLMPELTVEAATRAALGAGAKIWRVYSHEMTEDDVVALNDSPPDIFLLTGGTDGGNKENILANAALLARHLTVEFPIVIAGNRVAAKEAASRLQRFHPVVCGNVMPRLGVLEVEQVQEAIRGVFLKHIVNAKGLHDVASELVAPLIPTPSAVLTAIRLLARGDATTAGMGDIMAADIGGATTDLYSIGEGLPTEAAATLRGLPEPYAKRTVEGDIGMRYSCRGVVEAVGEAVFCADLDLDAAALEKALLQREDDVEWLAETSADKAFDQTLAAHALRVAFMRHAGQLETVYTPVGKSYVQTGKDLRPIQHVIFTGGPLVASHDPQALLRTSLQTPANHLLPLQATALVDRRYTLSALGLLATWQPEKALRMIQKELQPHE